MTVYSQDSTKVANKTLENFKRFADKCDTLKVAYFSQTLVLDSLIIENNKMFNDFKAVREDKFKLQTELDQKEHDFHKILQRPTRGWLIPLVLGAAIGIIVVQI